MQGKHAPHKKRISAWTNPWLIAIAGVMFLLGLPMVLWILTYHSDAAVSMFIITWVSLTFIVVAMAKSSLNDPRYYISRNVLARTRREIHSNRQETRSELLRNEVAALSRGERTPVLDIWRLDANLAKRHVYCSSLEVVLLDPQTRELLIRVQIGEVDRTEGKEQGIRTMLLDDIAAFLKIIVGDPYLLALKRFFDRIVLQIDSLREDDRHVDAPYPIVSILTEFSALRTGVIRPDFGGSVLADCADVKCEGGAEIQPHRSIETAPLSGSK